MTHSSEDGTTSESSDFSSVGEAAAGLAPNEPKPVLVEAAGWPKSPPLAAALLLF